MRHTNALLTCVVLASALLVPSGSAEAAAPTCQGKRATVVGGEGTGRNDVIVTNGVYDVQGKGGDDLICVTKGRAGVDAGPGDDTVVSQVKARFPNASLGPGDDVYLGTNGEDNVSPGPGKDIVRTFGGTDAVFLGQGAAPATVDLGAGKDTVVITRRSGAADGGSAGRARVDGGPGRDTLQVYVRGNRTVETWRFDAVRGVVTVDNMPVLHWDDIQTYDLTRLQGRAIEVVFKGNGQDERVDLSNGYSEGRRLRLNLGGGDDDVRVMGKDNGSVRLGSGRDVLTFHGGESAGIHLGSHSGDLAHPDGVTSHFELRGVDDVTTVDVPNVLMFGDSRANALRAKSACVVSLDGRGDEDRLHVEAGACVGDTSFELWGGAADDVLVGSFLDDLLNGGAGVDEAFGKGGQDTCYAEKRSLCELP
jgi:Ca2+-binding RTX toxin-like protein